MHPTLRGLQPGMKQQTLLLCTLHSPVSQRLLVRTLRVPDARLPCVDVAHSALLEEPIQYKLVVIAGLIRQRLGLLSSLVEVILRTVTRCHRWCGVKLSSWHIFGTITIATESAKTSFI